MSVTVKDVAKKAGVATSTVSRVVNDHPSISEDTKRKYAKSWLRWATCQIWLREI